MIYLRLIVALLAAVCFIPLTSSQPDTPTTVQYSISEEQPSGIFVGNLLDHADIKERISQFREVKFSFLDPNGLNVNMFRVDERMGIIQTTKRLDRETICSFHKDCDLPIDVAVKVMKGTGANMFELFTVLRVVVSIKDINDNKPSFLSRTVNLTVSEAVNAGYSILIRGATDPDSGQGNSIEHYNIVSGSDVFSLSVIENVGGSTDLGIVTKHKLDREATQSYQLLIEAKDGGRPSLTGTLTVNVHVLDANDNRPVFSNTSFHIGVQENLNPGTAIIQLTALDADEGDNGRITYNFDSRTSQKVLDVFSLNNSTGILSVTGNLDFEKQVQYKLLVEARDHGVQSQISRTLVTIDVIDVNDNAPLITISLPPYGAIIPESSETGSFVADMSVRDDDSGTNQQLECNILNDKFRLERYYLNLYKILLNKQLDFEKSTIENLTVVCQDKGETPLYDEKTVVIHVDDVNDHSPVFMNSSYNVSITENNRVGASLVTVWAVDGDSSENSRVGYRIESRWSDMVSVHPVTGVIVAAAPLDRERTPSITFTVIATDSASNPRSTNVNVTVNIKDENDNAPTFSREQYIFHVSEDESVGRVIGKVIVVDNDTGENGEIRLSVLNSSYYFFTYFAFNITTKDIWIIKALDREAIRNFTLFLNATDHGNPSLTTIARIFVVIDDVNDNRPVILFPNNKNSSHPLAHNSLSGDYVTRILSIDRDLGLNAKLNYKIISGNSDQLFFIESDTGIIRLLREIQRAEITIHKLQISVRDNGFPSLSTNSSLNISIYVSNETRAITHYVSDDDKNILIIVIIIGLTIVISATIVAIILILKRYDKTVFCSKINTSLSKPCSFETIFEEKVPNLNLSSDTEHSLEMDGNKSLVSTSQTFTPEQYDLFISMSNEKFNETRTSLNLESDEMKCNISDSINSDSGRGMSDGEVDDGNPSQTGKTRSPDPSVIKSHEKYRERRPHSACMHPSVNKRVAKDVSRTSSIRHSWNEKYKTRHSLRRNSETYSSFRIKRLAELQTISCSNIRYSTGHNPQAYVIFKHDGNVHISGDITV